MGSSAGNGWGVAGMAGLIAATDFELWDPPRVRHAVFTAALAAIRATLITALIDWYWILPRVGGITRLAPCEEAGGQKWARATGVWLHRGVATFIVSGSLTGVAGYMQQVEMRR